MKDDFVYEELKRITISSHAMYRAVLNVLDEATDRNTFDKFYNILQNKSLEEMIDLIKRCNDNPMISRAMEEYIMEIISFSYPEKFVELLENATRKESEYRYKPFQKIINYIKKNH